MKKLGYSDMTSTDNQGGGVCWEFIATENGVEAVESVLTREDIGYDDFDWELSLVL